MPASRRWTAALRRLRPPDLGVGAFRCCSDSGSATEPAWRSAGPWSPGPCSATTPVEGGRPRCRFSGQFAARLEIQGQCQRFSPTPPAASKRAGGCPCRRTAAAGGSLPAQPSLTPRCIPALSPTCPCQLAIEGNPDLQDSPARRSCLDGHGRRQGDAFQPVSPSQESGRGRKPVKDGSAPWASDAADLAGASWRPAGRPICAWPDPDWSFGLEPGLKLGADVQHWYFPLASDLLLFINCNNALILWPRL